jgi:radical SAM protein with 4Fe4S-binding SPASM domain
MEMDEAMTGAFFSDVRRVRAVHPAMEIRVGSAFARWASDAGTCTAAVSELVLDPNGDASPCSGFTGVIGGFGNVHTAGGLRVLWQSEALAATRARVHELHSLRHGPLSSSCELCPAQELHRQRLQFKRTA